MSFAVTRALHRSCRHSPILLTGSAARFTKEGAYSRVPASCFRGRTALRRALRVTRVTRSRPLDRGVNRPSIRHMSGAPRASRDTCPPKQIISGYQETGNKSAVNFIDETRGYLLDSGPCVVNKWRFGRPVPSVETTFTRSNPVGDETKWRVDTSVLSLCHTKQAIWTAVFFTTQGPEPHRRQ